jgi:glycerophosphoryl diester phosphodiesterase
MTCEVSSAALVVAASVGVLSAALFGQASVKINVAHRGASAYAPEHTAPAYRLAIEQGADYIEQDLAVTRDGVLVSIHDPTLERTTDVEALFPDRHTVDAKGQKRWLVVDFTLAEIKRLDAGSWFGARFAGEKILTWDEVVDVVAGRAGLYPEMKTPELYRERGIDIVAVFADAIRKRGLDVETPIRGRAPLVLQSFDEQAVRDAERLLPNVPRTLLIGSEAMADQWLSSVEAIRTIATFATGIGPAKPLVVKRPELVRWAHEAGLTVTPYTFRSTDTGAFIDVTAEMEHFLYALGVDALFTDNPDRFPRK